MSRGEFAVTPAAKEYRDAILAELRAAGMQGVTIINQTKHPRAQWSHKGEPRTYIFPSTPGDGNRGLKNCVADVRRILRQDGLLPADSEPRPPKSSPPIERARQQIKALEAELAQANSTIAALRAQLTQRLAPPRRSWRRRRRRASRTVAVPAQAQLPLALVGR